MIKEILIYTLTACASLFVLGYSIHMLVGGLVSKKMEIGLIALACVLGAIAIGYMAWDVIKRRRAS